MSSIDQALSGRSTAAMTLRRHAFVDLDRCFSVVKHQNDPDAAGDDSYLRHVFGGHSRLGWKKLLSKPLVVVLGEPGSGKSWETEYQAWRLAASGQFAFFIRLEDLIDKTPAEVLGSAAPDFAKWSSSSESACFFLDSVDESKLHGTEDFYSTLRHFREALPGDFAARAHIVLSSRVSEWHPETDGARVCEYFGLSDRLELVDSDDEEGESRTKPGESGLLVVQINALDREQVAKLARAKGHDRADDFLAALDRAHAWEFARRPIDVIALADFWQQHGRIGTLTELIEFDLQRSLCERRAHTGDPLTDADARFGAEALAAGVVFCGQARIKVSDEGLTGDGLNGRLCVPLDFTRDQYDALLTRPVFDGASYGRVRFHHRRVREYLAASWVNGRMRGGCSVAELDGLFFDHIGGRRILRPSRAPVAAWLCAGGEPWNATMRGWILEASPELNLRYGDPHALPLDYKQSILAKLVESARSRGRLWLNTDADALGRLADPALVPQIDTIIRDRSLAIDLRAAMLQVIRHSRVTACLTAALELMADPAESNELKTFVVAALRDISDRSSIIRLAEIASSLPRVTPALTDLLLEVLFPVDLSIDGFVALLRKTRERTGRLPSLEWQISSTLAEHLSPEHAGSLLERLIVLLQAEPHLVSEPGEPRISQEFAWLRSFVMITVTVLLRKPVLSSVETTNLAIGLAFIGSLRERLRHSSTDDVTNLQKQTLAHPAVRQTFFWSVVVRRRPLGLHAVDHPFDIFSRYDGLLEPAQSDLDWLMADLNRSDASDREVAIHHVMQWFNDLGRPWLLRGRIYRLIKNDPQLLATWRKLDRDGRLRPFKRYYYRARHAYHRGRRQGEAAYGWFIRHIRRIRMRYRLRKDLAKIARGELPGALNFLLGKAERGDGNHLAVSKFVKVERKFGAAVNSALRSGCKAYWRTYRPQLPHECPDSSCIPNELVIGLTGLHMAWADGEFTPALLSDDDVKTATRYAMREINGFPVWLLPLAEARPDLIGEIFAECVVAEWDVPTDRQRPFDGLQRLAWGAAPLLPVVRTLILSRLRTGDPTGRSLGLILGHLVRASSPPLADLSALASSRLADPATATGSMALWFAVWLQIAPVDAIAAWETYGRSRPDANDVMVSASAALQDRDLGEGPRIAQPCHLTVPVIRKLLPIVFAHVQPSADIDPAEEDGEDEGHTPGVRDYAQEFRSGLLRELGDSTDPSAADALLELSALPACAGYRDWILHLRDENLQQQADRERWQPSYVRQFTVEHESDPQTDRDLYRIVLKRLGDVKNDLERSDLGLRTHLRPNDRESRLRSWVAQELQRRARQRYTVPQEAVIDQEERPDIRLENPRTDSVSVEIKWAQNCSFNELVDALEHQLLGQYLRAHNSRHGVLIIGMHDGGRQGWNPSSGNRLNFNEVIAFLQEKAIELERNHPEVKRLTVMELDFRDHGSRP
jgi:hypothetical protein